MRRSFPPAGARAGHLNVQLKWDAWILWPIFSSRYWHSLKCSENAVDVSFSEWHISVVLLFPFSIVAVALWEVNGDRSLVHVNKALCVSPQWTWVTLGLLLLSPVTARGQAVPEDVVTQLLWARLDLRSGAVPWSYLYETHQTQRGVCAAVTSVKYNLVVTDGAKWLLEANYSTQVPPFEVLVNSLYPKCSVLSALCDLLPSFSACLTWGKTASMHALTVFINREYQLPSILCVKTKKGKRKCFSFSQGKPINAVSWLKSYSISMCMHTHMHRCEREETQLNFLE